MDIIVYQFSKRENSTKRPTTGQTVSCVLKDNCSRYNPIFILDISNKNYNYIKWEDRFYWVNDIVYQSNYTIEMSCSIDVLASYRNLIGLSTQYVLRSASNYDSNIIDNLYPTKAGATVSYGTISNVPWTWNGGYYIIGVLQTHGSVAGAQKRGGVTYVVTTSDNIASMIESMSTEEALTNNINPLDYISTCTYVPFNIAVGNTNTLVWTIAGQNVHLTYYLMPVQFWSEGFQVNLPIHPDYATRGAYVGYSPYTRYTLNAGPFGQIEIPTELLGDVKILYCHLFMDIISGEAVLNIYNNHDQSINTPVIVKTKARVSVPIQLSQLSSGNTVEARTRMFATGLQIGTSLLNPLGYITGGNVSNIASAGASAISNAIDMVTPRIHTNGSNGSFSDLRDTVSVVGEFYLPVEDNLEDHGRPLCKSVQINTLSGFILCQDADISGIATYEELNMIKNYMNNGFFYE